MRQVTSYQAGESDGLPVARPHGDHPALGAPEPDAPARATRGHYALLAAITGVATFCYAWAANGATLEPYYQAAVRSMAASWHNFFFGAFDPDGLLSVDKLPGALWLQALAVRAFGTDPWVFVLPQIVLGALTVIALFRAVARLAGPTAGLVAAAVCAVSPPVVMLSRGNISDDVLRLVDCTQFLVSTDGKRFGHPDDDAIHAIANAVPGAKILVNYPSIAERPGIKDLVTLQPIVELKG